MNDPAYLLFFIEGVLCRHVGGPGYINLYV